MIGYVLCTLAGVTIGAVFAALAMTDDTEAE